MINKDDLSFQNPCLFTQHINRSLANSQIMQGKFKLEFILLSCLILSNQRHFDAVPLLILIEASSVEYII